MFCNILKVFTISFEEFNTYLLNKILNFLQTCYYICLIHTVERGFFMGCNVS